MSPYKFHLIPYPATREPARSASTQDGSQWVLTVCRKHNQTGHRDL